MENMHYMATLTKKYIIDFLNGLTFEKSISWSGKDQYNDLYVLSSETDDNKKIEQRGALLCHKKFPQALRMLVTFIEDGKQQVCYRITGLKNQISIDDPKKIYLPFDSLKLDFSLSNLNLGLMEISSYSFCDNLGDNNFRVFSLLKFLLDSAVVVKEDKNIFDDLLLESISYPPFAGDVHYKPLFEIKDTNSENLWD